MANLRVSGFKHVSFWAEHDIGIIAVRTDTGGKANVEMLGELVIAVSNAAVDENVLALVITGTNNNFLAGLLWNPESQDFLHTLDTSHTLVNLLIKFEKPIFALLNGDCMDFGYELALITDYIIATEGSRVGFSRGYTFIAGGSVTWNRFRSPGVQCAEERVNVDRVLPMDSFLDKSMDTVRDLSSFPFSIIRQQMASQIVRGTSLEADLLIRNYIEKNKG
ncbi:MAG: enoyl-CoA hydratase-related protein [Candidatus Thermoplasmatota archaeon]|nr:enoyl-CoA hydratase-related protein [Candidatus Thermoplasmatota archaeon]